MSGRRAVIVANGGANIASLQFALQRLDASSSVSADPDEIRAASHVILPGVGAAADAMSRLRTKAMHAASESFPAARRAFRRLPSVRCRTWAGTLSKYSVPVL